MNSVKPLHVGMRTFKTALATAFCAFIYYFTDRSPAFACIGVIFGMGANMEDARKNGGNRLFLGLKHTGRTLMHQHLGRHCGTLYRRTFGGKAAKQNRQSAGLGVGRIYGLDYLVLLGGDACDVLANRLAGDRGDIEIQ